MDYHVQSSSSSDDSMNGSGGEMEEEGRRKQEAIMEKERVSNKHLYMYIHTCMCTNI